MEHWTPRRPSISRDSVSLDSIPIAKVDFLTFCIRTRHFSDEEANAVLHEAVEAILAVEELLALFRRLDRVIRQADGEVIKQLKSRRDDLSIFSLSLLPMLHRPRFGRFLPKTRRRLLRQIQYRIAKYPPPKPEMEAWAGDPVEYLTMLFGGPSSKGESAVESLDFVVHSSQSDDYSSFSWVSLRESLTKIEKIITGNAN